MKYVGDRCFFLLKNFDEVEFYEIFCKKLEFVLYIILFKFVNNV